MQNNTADIDHDVLTRVNGVSAGVARDSGELGQVRAVDIEGALSTPLKTTSIQLKVLE